MNAHATIGVDAPDRFEWSVRWRRPDWRYPHRRFYQTERGAVRVADLLTSAGHYAEVVVDRRPVGDWTTVHVADGSPF
jgi:hypothetical protein